MSDEDSLGEVISPARLMPKAQTLPEHHRILNVSAVHHGNTLATIKAHKVRIDGIEERVDGFDDLREQISDLKDAIVSTREASQAVASRIELSVSSLQGIVSRLDQKQAIEAGGIDVKKVMIQGFFGLLIACVSAFGAYALSHSPTGPKYEAPTHAQAVQIDQQYQAQDPENLKRIHQ